MRLSTAGSRLREAALTGLSIFAVAAAGLVFTYRTAQEALLDQIRSQIRQNASLVASQIEPRLHASLTRLEQMDGADYRRTAAPLLHWGGAHGAFLYGLAREYGRGARARGGESALQSWMLGLLEASGLRETVSCITEAGRSAERSTVEVLLGARLVECKCIL